MTRTQTPVGSTSTQAGDDTVSVLTAEAVGTFILVFAGGGAGVALALNGVKNAGELLLVAALAHGLALVVIVNIFGRVSGAHVNPAVTLALASVKRFDWARVPGYIGAQFVGAFVGALAIVGIYGQNALTMAGASAPSISPSVTGLQGLLAEALGAFILIFAIMATVADNRFTLPSGWAGLIIGLALAVGIFATGFSSGAGLNPALSLGPYIMDLFIKNAPVHYDQIPIYLIGPVIGGVGAAFLYRFITRMK